MAKKKVIRKKIITIKTKLDLSGKDKQSEADIIASLQSLLADNGWEVLVNIFKANIEILEDNILDRRALTEIECDRLRFKREYLLELINKPKEIIEKLQSQPPDAPSYDPYEEVGDKKN